MGSSGPTGDCVRLSAHSVILKSKVLNGWNLFSLITVPISLAVVMAMATADLSSAGGISSMLQLSVRCSVPWLYLAFAASSIHMLFPSEFSRWLLRNRRIIGLCFAAGMAWQLAFILWMVTGYWGYYVDEVYLFADVAVQIPGYVFLTGPNGDANLPLPRASVWRLFFRNSDWRWWPR